MHLHIDGRYSAHQFRELSEMLSRLPELLPDLTPGAPMDIPLDGRIMYVTYWPRTGFLDVIAEEQ